jgi:hypothetical protein
MTTLPQLERELKAAHAGLTRRRRPWAVGVRGAGFAAAAVLVAAVFAVLALTVTNRHRAHPVPSAPVLVPAPPSTAPGFGRPRVLRRQTTITAAYAAGGVLYAADQLDPSSRYDLLALDPTSGALVGRVNLAGTSYCDALLAGGSLWVTSSGAPQHSTALWLWRLAPETLTVRSRVRLPGANPGGACPALALAGASMWFGDGTRLDRATLPGGRIVADIPVPGAQTVQVASGPGGRTLLVSVGNDSGVGYIQRRDPHSGALLASSAKLLGVAGPGLGGAAGDVIWINESGGMISHAERLDLATLRRIGVTVPPGASSNGFEAQTIGGILWVSESEGGASRNYCGNAFTGRSLLAMPRSEQAGRFLAADGTSIYYLGLSALVKGTDHVRTDLMTATIGTRCRR